MEQGKITKGIGGFYYVDTGNAIIETRARGKFRNMGIKPMVGDMVQIENNYVYEILPRKNELIRPPVSNVDQIAIVVAAREPEADLTLVDKLTVQAVSQEIDTLIIVNKSDIDDARAHEIADIYARAGFESIVASIHEDSAIEEIKKRLTGKTTAFAGNSGVGKSSILKNFGIDAPTGELSKINRGKHTTRHVELFKMNTAQRGPRKGGNPKGVPLWGEARERMTFSSDLCSETEGSDFASTYVLDTPGFSILDLTNLDKTRLAGYFPELAEVTCAYPDCTHMPRENGCEANSRMSPSRLESYRTLFDS